METESVYKTELHIWLDSRDEFEESQDKLRRGLKKIRVTAELFYWQGTVTNIWN